MHFCAKDAFWDKDKIKLLLAYNILSTQIARKVDRSPDKRNISMVQSKICTPKLRHPFVGKKPIMAYLFQI
jgi:hypothetical protein